MTTLIFILLVYTKGEGNWVKKTVLEIFFLDDFNFYVSPGIPSFVYRHFSTIKVFRIKRLALKLKVSLEKLLVSLFLKLLSDQLNRKILYLINKINAQENTIWKYEENAENKNKLPGLIKSVKRVKAYSPDTEQLAIKFEIKIVKNKFLLSIFYPEQPISEKISAMLLRDYEKIVRNILKSYDL